MTERAVQQDGNPPSQEVNTLVGLMQSYIDFEKKNDSTHPSAAYELRDFGHNQHIGKLYGVAEKQLAILNGLPTNVLDLFFRRELHHKEDYSRELLGKSIIETANLFARDRQSQGIHVFEGERTVVMSEAGTMRSIPDFVIGNAIANPSKYEYHEYGTDESKVQVIVISNSHNNSQA